MGRDKALLELEGVALIVRTARLVESAAARCAIVGDTVRLEGLELLVIEDEFPGAGPLGGIATALRASGAGWNLIVACDLPYLTREWLEFLIGHAMQSDANAVLPMNDRGAEPLCAMYHKRAESAIRGALDRGVRKVTDGLAEVRTGRAPEAMSDHYIEFRNVSKAFDDNPVLKNVSFFVDQGETAVIMGRSGVGKSVSLKLLLGFLQPDDGQIIVAGQDVTFFTEEQFSEIRRIVTMVFQSGALFDSLTVAENVAFPFEARGARPDDEEVDKKVSELLKTLNLTEYADRLPSDLSMGTKRSVAIARALAEDPQAILYDEPTTMVDPLMAAHMSDLIVRLKKTLQKTSIVVTHDTHLAKKLADRVIFLQEGRVGFFGTWKELEASKDPFLRNFLKEDELIPALDATE